MFLVIYFIITSLFELNKLEKSINLFFPFKATYIIFDFIPLFN